MAIAVDIIFVCAFYLEQTPEGGTTFTLRDRAKITSVSLVEQEHAR